MKTPNYYKLPFDKVKIITTATKVTDSGAKTTPITCALALRRNNGKWETEATALPRGASVPVYKCVDGKPPAAAYREMWRYLGDIAERNFSRCCEMLREYSADRHSFWLTKIQAAATKYSIAMANCRAKFETFSEIVDREAKERRNERERKEAEIVKNGSTAYIDAAAEKASERYLKIEERVNKRAAANAVKAA